MAHPTMCDRRMRRQHCGRSVAVGHSAEARDGSDRVAGKVLTGEDGEHTGGRVRRLVSDRADGGMRVRRAQHEGMRLAGPDDIVEVIAVPGDEAPVFDAADRLTDAELLHGDDLRAWTACKDMAGSARRTIFPYLRQSRSRPSCAPSRWLRCRSLARFAVSNRTNAVVAAGQLPTIRCLRSMGRKSMA